MIAFSRKVLGNNVIAKNKQFCNICYKRHVGCIRHPAMMSVPMCDKSLRISKGGGTLIGSSETFSVKTLNFYMARRDVRKTFCPSIFHENEVEYTFDSWRSSRRFLVKNTYFSKHVCHCFDFSFHGYIPPNFQLHNHPQIEFHMFHKLSGGKIERIFR